MHVFSAGYSTGIEETLFEQRRSERFEMKLPVLVVREGRMPVCNMGETINLSSSGVLMSMQAPIATGESIEYFIMLAASTGKSHEVRLHCKGRVVRNERSSCAATIDRYELLRGGESKANGLGGRAVP